MKGYAKILNYQGFVGCVYGILIFIRHKIDLTKTEEMQEICNYNATSCNIKKINNSEI